MEAIRNLRMNGALQIAGSSCLGVMMLFPMQTWWPKSLKLGGRTMKEIGSVHLDYYMLAFMQFSAASLLQNHVEISGQNENEVQTVCKLLMFGGLANPTAYLFRAFGINAFVIDPRASVIQNLAATFGAVSAVSILVAWAKIYGLLENSEKRGAKY